MKEKEDEIPKDVLLDEATLKKFMEIFKSKIISAKAAKDALLDQVKDVDRTINALKDNYKTLEEYQILLKHKGFANMKILTEAFSDEIKEAQKQRIAAKKEAMKSRRFDETGFWSGSSTTG